MRSSFLLFFFFFLNVTMRKAAVTREAHAGGGLRFLSGSFALEKLVFAMLSPLTSVRTWPPA